MFDIKTIRECVGEEYGKAKQLVEGWSPAARAASAAARKGRGKGLKIRKGMARKAFRKEGGIPMSSKRRAAGLFDELMYHPRSHSKGAMLSDKLSRHSGAKPYASRKELAKAMKYGKKLRQPD